MIITIDDSEVRGAINQLKKTIPAAGKAASRAALKELVEKLRDRVRKMIPDEGGWYDVYRRGIKIIEHSPDHYELTTEFIDVPYDVVEPEKVALTLSPSDDVSSILSGFGFWTWDTIPAVKSPGAKAGFKSDITLWPASESEIETIRRARLSDRPDVERRIKALGKSLYPLDAEVPVINGKAKANVPFLARRLEYGLGGFPRTPIWSRLDIEAAEISKGKSVEDAGAEVFNDRWHRPKK